MSDLTRHFDFYRFFSSTTFRRSSWRNLLTWIISVVLKDQNALLKKRKRKKKKEGLERERDREREKQELDSALIQFPSAADGERERERERERGGGEKVLCQPRSTTT